MVLNRRYNEGLLARGAMLVLGVVLMSSIALSQQPLPTAPPEETKKDLLAPPPPPAIPEAAQTVGFQPPPVDSAPPVVPVTPLAPPVPPPPPAFTPPTPNSVDPTLPPLSAPMAPAPTKPPPRVSIRSRFGTGIRDVRIEKPDPNGMTAVIISGGVIIFISDPAAAPDKKTSFLDIEADQVVIWTKGSGQQLFNNVTGPDGDGNAHELYLAGNVELRLAHQGGD